MNKYTLYSTKEVAADAEIQTQALLEIAKTLGKGSFFQTGYQYRFTNDERLKIIRMVQEMKKIWEGK